MWAQWGLSSSPRYFDLAVEICYIYLFFLSHRGFPIDVRGPSNIEEVVGFDGLGRFHSAAMENYSVSHRQHSSSWLDRWCLILYYYLLCVLMACTDWSSAHVITAPRWVNESNERPALYFFPIVLYRENWPSASCEIRAASTKIPNRPLCWYL